MNIQIYFKLVLLTIFPFRLIYCQSGFNHSQINTMSLEVTKYEESISTLKKEMEAEAKLKGEIQSELEKYKRELAVETSKLFENETGDGENGAQPLCIAAIFSKVNEKFSEMANEKSILAKEIESYLCVIRSSKDENEQLSETENQHIDYVEKINNLKMRLTTQQKALESLEI